MNERQRTHRDTLAFVLAMTGATMWALFPAAAVLRHDGWGNVLIAALVAGAGFGALAAAMVWRTVSLATAGVAGAVSAVLALGILGYFRHRGAPALGVGDLATAAGASASAIGGAALGRWIARPSPSLAVALIAMSSGAVTGTALGLIELHGELTPGTAWLLVLGPPIPAITAGVWLCRGARPGGVAAWVFGLTVSMFSIVALVDINDKGTAGIMLGGVLTSVLLAFGAAGATALAQRLLPAPPPAPAVPAAHVVVR